MPGKIGVKIKAGRNLPIMDRTNETTDAYVEIKLGNVTHKTDVCRKSLNPHWNSDWFRFELDDAELQDEPLQIRLMDHDTYSANDAIGKVNINLNPLCLESATQQGHSKGNVLSGWIPVFDTMHGIRGEVNIVVKVDLFSDVNKFRQSSCGVQFFHSPCVPFGYRAQFVHGFVEELVVNDDPEYQWIDKIRTPRASNEARQMVFLKLSGQVQRKIGLKAINMGANAVIGYKQCFDLEGDVGVVARGIGTAVTLIKETNNQNGTTDNILLEESQDSQDLEKSNVLEPLADPGQSSGNNLLKNKESVQLEKAGHNAISQISPTKSILSNGQCGDTLSTTTSSVSTNATIIQKDFSDAGRRSSDSDISITPKGNSVSVGSERLMGVNTLMRIGQPTSIKTMNNDGGFDMLEYPFLTLNKYPPGFILSIGATVAARSVKLLERVPNPDEPEVRDSWWTELRMEIRSHARALGCNVVLGYSESTTISDDVCVLSATGTAAVIDMAYNSSISQNDLTTTKPVTDPSDDQHYKDNTTVAANILHGSNSSFGLQKKYASILPSNTLRNPCNICHIVYNQNSMPFSMKLKKCSVCGKGKVPDVLLATLEVPDFLPVTGRGSFVQAQVVRCKKDLRAESNAKEISDGLPFLEYELHRVLINKLKAKGMNGIFGLKTQVAIGERMISLIATGTAIFLTALPTPHVPKIVGGNSWTDKQKLIELQKKLQETLEKNQEIFQLKPLDPDSANDKNSDSEESEEEAAVEVDLNFGNKDACILEVDDIEDLEIISLIMEPYPPEGFYVVNTQSVPGVEIDMVKNVQMFTQIWRARLDIGQNVIGFQKHFQRILQTIYFKLRSMMPCMICDLKFRLDLPESDQIQLLVIGIAISASESPKYKNRRRLEALNPSNETNMPVNQLSETPASAKSQNDEELMFPLDEENVLEMKSNNMSHYLGQAQKLRKPSPSRTLPKLYNSIMHKRNIMLRDRTAVDISPLYSIPGRKIDKYLGNLNFFFIRESTSIRENGGISGFVHSFITELLAVVRAHIAALGGNAMVSFYMTELILLDNQHKNQGQCLISIGGDAVYTTSCNIEE